MRDFFKSFYLFLYWIILYRTRHSVFWQKIERPRTQSSFSPTWAAIFSGIFIQARRRILQWLFLFLKWYIYKKNIHQLELDKSLCQRLKQDTVKLLTSWAKRWRTRSNCKMISDFSVRESPSQLEYPFNNNARHAVTVIIRREMGAKQLKINKADKINFDDCKL